MKITAYVDGSFDKNTGVYGCGIVYILPGVDKPIEEAFGGNEALFAKSWNIGGELLAALIAVERCVATPGCDEIEIVHDLEGTANYVLSKNEMAKPLTQYYRQKMKENMEKITITFRWTKGHSTNVYNNLADNLARQGIKKFLSKQSRNY